MAGAEIAALVHLQPFFRSLCVDSARSLLTVSPWAYVRVSSDGLGTRSECIPAGIDSSTLTTLISRNMMDADALHMRFTVATVSPSASVCSRIFKKNPTVTCFYFTSSTESSGGESSDPRMDSLHQTHIHTRQEHATLQIHISDQLQEHLCW